MDRARKEGGSEVNELRQLVTAHVSHRSLTALGRASGVLVAVSALWLLLVGGFRLFSGGTSSLLGDLLIFYGTGAAFFITLGAAGCGIWVLYQRRLAKSLTGTAQESLVDTVLRRLHRSARVAERTMAARPAPRSASGHAPRAQAEPPQETPASATSAEQAALRVPSRAREQSPKPAHSPGSRPAGGRSAGENPGPREQLGMNAAVGHAEPETAGHRQAS